MTNLCHFRSWRFDLSMQKTQRVWTKFLIFGMRNLMCAKPFLDIILLNSRKTVQLKTSWTFFQQFSWSSSIGHLLVCGDWRTLQIWLSDLLDKKFVAISPSVGYRRRCVLDLLLAFRLRISPAKYHRMARIWVQRGFRQFYWVPPWDANVPGDNNPRFVALIYFFQCPGFQCVFVSFGTIRFAPFCFHIRGNKNEKAPDELSGRHVL